MASRQYKKLKVTAMQAAERLYLQRRSLKAQLHVCQYYDYGMRRATKPVQMTVWELDYVMTVTLDGVPLRYNLLLSTKGEFVGYVTHAVHSALYGKELLRVLAVLSPEHFDQLSEDGHRRLLLEVESLAGTLGAAT